MYMFERPKRVNIIGPGTVPGRYECKACYRQSI